MTPDEKHLNFLASLEPLEDVLQASFRRFQYEQRANAQAKASDQVLYEEAYSMIKTSRNRTSFCFMTINPRPGTEYDVLQAVCTAAFDSYFEWYVYAFELRKNSEGLHCHVLGKIKPSRNNTNFSRIKNYFRELIGNLKHVDTKFVVESEIKKVFDYITKTSVAKSKSVAHKATLKWREDNGIDSHWTVGDLPTCLVPDPSDAIEV